MNNHPRLPILVAVGDSDDHDAALRFAAEEALRVDRPLQLVHVIHPPAGVMVPEQLLISFEAAELVAQQLLRSQVERAKELTHGRVYVERVMRRGPVVDTLVELSGSADHVVLQHRQQARLVRVFTGSTSAGVAGRAAVPVVSVPEMWSGSDTVQGVTVGLDDSSDHDALLGLAFREAAARRAGLTLLHAWFVSALYDDTMIDRIVVHEWRTAARTRIDQETEKWRSAYPTVDVRVEVPHMRPADALVEASGHADLLLVGRRHSGHGMTHLGSTARAVIRESRCPVMVVAPDAAHIEHGAGPTQTAELGGTVTR